jgi:hypothetical protein
LAVSRPDIVGVVSVGEVAKARSPDPVEVVMADSRLADDGVARKVATFVPSPLMPDDTGKPVQLVSVPDAGVPRVGVTSVGEAQKNVASWLIVH